MFHARRIQIILWVCMVCPAISFLSHALTRPSASVTASQNNVRDVTRIPVKVRSPRADQFIPVTLECEDSVLSAPNKIEGVSCELINQTGKYISSATVAISVLVEKDGKVSSDASYLTIETFLHPDLKEEGKDNRIKPNGRHRFNDVTTSYDDAVIKGVSVTVDYVEFDDSTTAGPNEAGAKIVADIRDGAAKYKRWLHQNYEKGGRSIDSVVSLLKNQPIPEDELLITNGDQQQGAVMYRNFAIRTYERSGAAGLSKHLQRSQR